MLVKCEGGSSDEKKKLTPFAVILCKCSFNLWLLHPANEVTRSAFWEGLLSYASWNRTAQHSSAWWREPPQSQPTWAHDRTDLKLFLKEMELPHTSRSRCHWLVINWVAQWQRRDENLQPRAMLQVFIRTMKRGEQEQNRTLQEVEDGTMAVLRWKVIKNLDKQPGFKTAWFDFGQRYMNLHQILAIKYVVLFLASSKSFCTSSLYSENCRIKEELEFREKNILAWNTRIYKIPLPLKHICY